MYFRSHTCKNSRPLERSFYMACMRMYVLSWSCMFTILCIQRHLYACMYVCNACTHIYAVGRACTMQGFRRRNHTFAHMCHTYTYQNKSLHTHIYTFILYIHIYIHTLHTYYTYMSTCMHIYIFLHNICICKHIYICMYVCMYVYVYTYIYTPWCAYIHACMYVYVYA